MYGREELDINKLVYATDIDTMLVDCEGTEVWPQDSDGCEYYFKSQADKVMDAMEARIKKLEHQVMTDCTCDSSKSATLRMDLYKAQERIKELEHKLYGSSGQSTRLLNRINNFRSTDSKATDLIEDCYKCIHQQMATISKMETTTPKWISVKDVLPQWGKLVKIKFKDGKEDERRFSADYKWVSKGMQTCESVDVTHWMPLPPPPTTEEK